MPITRHPLFPVMVGLWFAALFGLGSLAIRPSLLEAFVLKLHIDLVVPAAAPPLGLTARILLALSLFVIGGILGVVLARKIAVGRQAPVSVRTMPAKASSRTFTPAADDEDLERLAAARNALPANAIPGRRRALAMEEDYTQEYHDVAPIPGGPPQILDLADLGPMQDAGFEEEAAFPVLAAEEAVEPVVAREESAAVTFDPWNRHAPPPAPQAQEPELAAEPAIPHDVQPAFGAPVAQDRPFGQPSVQTQEFAPPVDVAEPNPFSPAPFAPFAAPQFAETLVEPVVSAVFAAPPSFASPASEAPEVRPEPALSPEPEPVAVFAQPAPRPMRLGQLPPDAAADLRSVSVDSLGVVQLAERLAMAISRRREAAAGPVATAAAPAAPEVLAPPPLPTPGPFAGLAPSLEDVPTAPVSVTAAAQMEQETPPPVAPFAAPAIPAALRPLSFNDDDHEPLELVLPPRSFAMSGASPVQPAFAAPEPATSAPFAGAAESAEDEGQDAYGSLLDLKPSTGSQFVRIDEPQDDFAEIEPVVVFPGQAPQPFAAQVAPFAPPSAPFAAPAPVIAAPAPPSAPLAPGQRFDIPPPPAAPIARSAAAEETERALKAALATLQRMSGAA